MATLEEDPEDLDDLLDSVLDDFNQADNLRASQDNVGEEGQSGEARQEATPQHTEEDETVALLADMSIGAFPPLPSSSPPLPSPSPLGLGGLGLPGRRTGKKPKQAKDSLSSSSSTSASLPAPASATKSRQSRGSPFVFPSASPSSTKGSPGGGVAGNRTSSSTKKPGAARGAAPSGASRVGEDSLASTLEQLAQKTKDTVQSMEEADGNGGEEGEEADAKLAEKLLQQIEEQLGGNIGEGGVESLMDGMMRQLLSRDVLEEPMREISARYPTWLAEHAAELAPEDVARYTRQQECIKELCHLYDSEPDNFDKILEVMQRMQECGQPPPEIVKELAPGVELGEDGLPMMPDFPLGSTSEGLPPNCSIM
eukprot:TRINITY_DN956_c0_g1_i1.p1 TRINITY_DN956_c0_g1~~TRINITY_DN956_c0_g1_i1.p1  ORF type:complete len:368 (-),score=103.29 TRINITY_DN956_c0_g1_i1:823-1926(-)